MQSADDEGGIELTAKIERRREITLNGVSAGDAAVCVAGGIGDVESDRPDVREAPADQQRVVTAAGRSVDYLPAVQIDPRQDWFENELITVTKRGHVVVMPLVLVVNVLVMGL